MQKKAGSTPCCSEQLFTVHTNRGQEVLLNILVGTEYVKVTKNIPFSFEGASRDLVVDQVVSCCSSSDKS